MKNKYTILSFFVLITLKVSALSAINDSTLNYQRNSLYSMMLNHSGRQFEKDIKSVFLDIPVPDKYNNHDLNVKIVNVSENKMSNMKDSIDCFIQNNYVASRMIAKWFDRNIENGVCNVDLIKSRGLYNASEFDKEFASQSKRGNALLEDAGENLISTTFLIVNDIRYIDRAKGSKTAGSIFKVLGGLASAYTGDNTYQALGNGAGALAESYKGFKVNIDTYLYQLVWDEETAMKFYTDIYTEESDSTKMSQFELNRDMFKLKYVGMQKSDGSNTSFLGVNEKEPQIMVRKACQRAIDDNIANLQKNYEAFKVKSPLVRADDIITAYIGMKDGVNENSEYEVLEAIENKDGIKNYKRVGTIKPVADKIWDNRFMAIEEKAVGADLGYTTFKKISGKDFYPGMLIREIK